MGRPRKTTDKRAWQLNLKLTRAEFDAIGIRATARGLHPVDYGRLMLLRPSEHNALSPIERSRWDQAAVLQLQKLGNLLNQAIRHLHRTHELLPEIAGLLRDIRIEINRSTS